jgi:hypothetical protein
MQLEIGICKGEDCGIEAPIVNKKYGLCQDCNFKRTHKGISRQDVYMARRKEKQSKLTIKAKTYDHLKQKTGSSYKLKSISTRESFHCSDGTLVSQRTVKSNQRLVYEIIDSEREQICQGTGRNDLPLSHSHTISERRCKEIGKTELAWDEDNIELEGFEAPTSNPIAAHNIWEVGTIEKKVMLINFDRKLEYIKKHDLETFRKYLIKIEESKLDEVIKQKYSNLYGR